MATTPTRTARLPRLHRLLAEGERAAGHEEAAARQDAIADVAAEVLHAEDRCERCGRRLSDPASVARHVGPDCQRLLERAQ